MKTAYFYMLSFLKKKQIRYCENNLTMSNLNDLTVSNFDSLEGFEIKNKINKFVHSMWKQPKASHCAMLFSCSALVRSDLGPFLLFLRLASGRVFKYGAVLMTPKSSNHFFFLIIKFKFLQEYSCMDYLIGDSVVYCPFAVAFHPNLF